MEKKGGGQDFSGRFPNIDLSDGVEEAFGFYDDFYVQTLSVFLSHILCNWYTRVFFGGGGSLNTTLKFSVFQTVLSL